MKLIYIIAFLAFDLIAVAAVLFYLKNSREKARRIAGTKAIAEEVNTTGDKAPQKPQSSDKERNSAPHEVGREPEKRAPQRVHADGRNRRPEEFDRRKMQYERRMSEKQAYPAGRENREMYRHPARREMPAYRDEFGRPVYSDAYERRGEPQRHRPSQAPAEKRKPYVPAESQKPQKRNLQPVRRRVKSPEDEAAMKAPKISGLTVPYQQALPKPMSEEELAAIAAAEAAAAKPSLRKLKPKRRRVRVHDVIADNPVTGDNEMPAAAEQTVQPEPEIIPETVAPQPEPEIIPEPAVSQPEPEIIPEPAVSQPEPEIIPETAAPQPEPEIIPETAAPQPEPEIIPEPEVLQPVQEIAPETAAPQSEPEQKKRPDVPSEIPVKLVRVPEKEIVVPRSPQEIIDELEKLSFAFRAPEEEPAEEETGFAEEEPQNAETLKQEKIEGTVKAKRQIRKKLVRLPIIRVPAEMPPAAEPLEVSENFTVENPAEMPAEEPVQEEPAAEEPENTTKPVKKGKVKLKRREPIETEKTRTVTESEEAAGEQAAEDAEVIEDTVPEEPEFFRETASEEPEIFEETVPEEPEFFEDTVPEEPEFLEEPVWTAEPEESVNLLDRFESTGGVEDEQTVSYQIEKEPEPESEPEQETEPEDEEEPVSLGKKIFGFLKRKPKAAEEQPAAAVEHLSEFSEKTVKAAGEESFEDAVSEEASAEGEYEAADFAEREWKESAQDDIFSSDGERNIDNDFTENFGRMKSRGKMQYDIGRSGRKYTAEELSELIKE